MTFSRRRLVLAAAALPALVRARPSELALQLLSAWAERDKTDVLTYFAGRVDGAAVPLPARAHAVLPDPTSTNACFVVARRPGEYLLRVDLARNRVSAQHEVDDAYCFAGHAIVDRARGRVLATEIDTLTGGGRIGVYDAATLRPLAVYSSHGVGPHELLMLGRNTLAVANGGIVELPETGRSKRNLDVMTPSLVLIDAHDGTLRSQFALSEPRASIRHLALARDGTLGMALQTEGAQEMPLLAILRNGSLSLAERPPQPLARYGAGISTCGNRFAVTCTRGNIVAVWGSDGGFVGVVSMQRPSGIAPDSRQAGWLVSNELGEIVRIDAERLQSRVVAHASRLWDNHLCGTG